MFVDGDAVEAELVAELELIEIGIVGVMPDLGVVVGVRHRHPVAVVRRDYIVRKARIRHQVEHCDFHGVAPARSWLCTLRMMKFEIADVVSSSFSANGIWPAPSIIVTLACGMNRLNSGA